MYEKVHVTFFQALLLSSSKKFLLGNDLCLSFRLCCIADLYCVVLLLNVSALSILHRLEGSWKVETCLSHHNSVGHRLVTCGLGQGTEIPAIGRLYVNEDQEIINQWQESICWNCPDVTKETLDKY